MGLKINQLTPITYLALSKKLVPDTEKEAKQALPKVFKQLRPKENDYSFRGTLTSKKGAVLMSDKSYKYAIPATHLKKNEKTKTQDWRSSLFLPDQNMPKHKKKLDQIPQWSFYITGHGTTNKVAELGIGKFQAMLNFFETAILTRLCIISSCYAAGVNVEKVYQEGDDYVTRLTYSFPIVLEASYDLPVRGTAKRLNPNEKQPFILDFSLFSAAIQEPFAAYQNVLWPLLTTLRTPEVLKKDINIPLLRLARRETFIPLYKAFEITEIMAQTRNQPIAFSTVYTKLKKTSPVDTVIVLLKTNFIPFPLDIRNIPLTPFFVAGLADLVYYYISEIKADTLDDILDSLQRNYVPQKSFLIKIIMLQNIATYADAFVYTDKQEIVHMIAQQVNTNNREHYTYDPQEDSSKKVKLTSTEIRAYENQLQEFPTSLEPAKQAEIKKLEQSMTAKLRTQPLRELQMLLSLLSFVAAN